MSLAAVLLAQTGPDHRGPYAGCWLLKSANGRERRWCDNCGDYGVRSLGMDITQHARAHLDNKHPSGASS
jgi:hypothetical protein